MGRRDSVLRRGEGRAGARERVPPEGEWEPGRGERAPRVGEGRGGGERPRGRGRGSCLEVGADPGSQERGTSEGAAPRSATNGGRARRTAQQDLSSPSPDAQLRVGKLLRRFPPPAPCGKQEPVIRRPRLGLPPPGPRGLPPTPRRCHRLRTGRMSPLFPPPPRGTRAPAERGSPGAACQLPSRPTLPWARPRSLAGGQHPHYRCQARELEQRAGGAGPGHGGAGCPPGC